MRWRNSGLGWRAALVGLVLLTAGAPAQEDPEAQFLNELTEAYVTFGRANRAREAQAWDEALQLYEDALAQYRRLHNLYPDRQAEIVQYRMADCANQVESLRRRATGKKGKASRAAEKEPEPEWRERYQTLLKENQYLHERLVELEEQAIAPAAAAEARPDFEEERARLTAQVEALRAETAQQSEAARAAGEVREQQAAEAARQLTGAREEIERLQEKSRDAGALLSQTKKERDEQKERARELSESVQTLTAELETGRQRLEAEQSAKEAALARARQAEQEKKKLREEAETPLTEARAALAQARQERDRLQEKLEKDEQHPAAADSPRAPLEKDGEAAPAVSVPDILGQAAALEKKGDLMPALALYRSAARQTPDLPNVVHGEARCLLKLGRSDEGVAILRPIVARGSSEPEARLLLGIGLCALHQYREATEVLRAALPVDPRNAALRNALGVAWIGRGNLVEARKELEQGVALDPLMGDAHMNLALVLAAGTAEDREAARRYYRRAIELGAPPESRLAESLGMR
jgi:Flp pilus assembly protein TadD